MYANFIESNNIEFGILLCNELHDNPLEGITYKEAKAFSHILDVIELNRVHENDDDEQNDAAISHHDPVGYDELLQAIRAIIWSNVDLTRKATARAANGTGAEAKIGEPTDTVVDDVDDSNIESELAGFEQLLTEVMMFKDTTSTWSRTERLAYAEKFACKRFNGCATRCEANHVKSNFSISLQLRSITYFKTGTEKSPQRTIWMRTEAVAMNRTRDVFSVVVV